MNFIIYTISFAKKSKDDQMMAIQIQSQRQQNNMGYKILLLTVLLIWSANSFTDLTMFNCPSQFDISVSNVTRSNVAASLGAFVYAGFQSQSSKARVQKIVVTGNTNDLSVYTKEMMAPYIIFGIIYLLAYLSIVVCCLFDRSCPPCDSLRRDLDNKPYSKCEIRLATISTIILAGGIFVTCMIAMSFVPDMRTDAQLSSCGIYVTLDTVLNGDGTWGGVISLRDKVGNITNLLSAAVTQIQIYFPGDSWLQDSMQSMRTANLNIYNIFKGSQLTTPNPDTTSVAINAGLPTPKIDSRFIKQYMGPNGTVNTMASDIDLSLKVTQKLSTQAYAITQSSLLLKESLATILSNSQASQTTLMMYIHQLQNVILEYEATDQDYFVKSFGKLLSILEGVFAFVLTGSLLVLLGVISSHVFDIYNCRSMVHLGWTIFGLTYVAIIGLTFVFLSVGSVGYGFCSYFDMMINDKVSYSKLGLSYTQNAFMKIDTCIFGDGNSLSKFGLAQQMGTVIKLFTDIQTYFDYTNSVSNNYVNLDLSISTINKWISEMQKYRLGINIDTNPIITSDDNPNYAIKQLNKYTYTGGGMPTGSMDVWVWDKANCTDPNQVIYQAGLSSGVSLTTTQVMCISFNEKIINTATNSWSFSDFTMRYIQVRQNYTSAYNRILYYGATLIAFRDSRLNLFQAIKDQLSSLLTQNTNFNTLLNNFKTRVTQFYSSVSILNNLITNPLNGLAVASNCASISGKLKFTYNVFCKNFFGEVVKICFCCLILLFLMFAAIFAGSRFGMIYAQIEKVKRIQRPEDSQSEKDIHMDNNESTDSNSFENNDEEED